MTVAAVKPAPDGVGQAEVMNGLIRRFGKERFMLIRKSFRVYKRFGGLEGVPGQTAECRQFPARDCHQALIHPDNMFA